MAETTRTATAASNGTAATTDVTSATTPATTPTGVAPLGTTRGTTTIADGVVSTIAGLTAREVPGVHALGNTASRAFGQLRERIPGASTNLSQGVRVEVGEQQAVVDLELVADYGVAISDLAADVRQGVIDAVERMTGLHVLEVNVLVSDVHLPEDEDEPVATTRVL